MTDTTHNADTDAPIAEQRQRLETIIEQLEAGEVPLEQANELYSEGTALIYSLEDELALGEGDISEVP